MNTRSIRTQISQKAGLVPRLLRSVALRQLSAAGFAQQLRAAIGLHESTVSRVTSNKYLATPSGVIELKRFFGRPMPKRGGQACSRTAIRQLLREMIDAQSPAPGVSIACPARQVSLVSAPVSPA